MSKSKAQQIFEGLKETVKENASLGKIFDDVKAEAKQQVAHGAHEVAAALFNGSGFVMYPRDGENQKEDPQHGLPEAAKQQEAQTPEQDRGMDM